MKKQMIIISPAKTFNTNNPLPSDMVRPPTLMMAREIFKLIRPMSVEQTKEMYKLSDKKAEEVWDMHQNHGKKLYYAIEAFYGSVFKQLNLDSYDKEWLNDNLRIIDPLYGILKPYDTIGLYRLDYTVKFDFDIKEYWRETVNNELKDYEIINLASKEYSSVINSEMIVPELVEGKTLKQQRGLTLDKIIKNKGL